MKKRILSLFLIMCMLLPCIPMAVFAETGTVSATGDFDATTGLTWTVYDGTKLVISKTGDGTGAMPDYTRSDDKPWEAYRTTITSAVIGDGITYIGARSFQECTALKTVTMADSVTSMGAYVFNADGALEAVKLSENLEQIPNGTFNGASALKALEIPYNTGIINESDRKSSFRGINKSVVLTVYEGSSAHTWAKGGTETGKTPAVIWNNKGGTAALSYKVKTVGSSDNSGNVTDDGSITWTVENDVLTISGTGEIPNYTRSDDKPWETYRTSITSVVIGDGITYIGDRTFQECTALKTVTMADSVTSMGTYVFNADSALESVKLSENLAEISENSFYNAKALKAIAIPFVTNIVAKSFRRASADLVITLYPYSKAYTWAVSSGTDGKTPEVEIKSGTNAQLSYEVLPMQGNVTDDGSITWTVENDVLTISGTGAMPDYAESNDKPWESGRTFITSVFIGDGITYIGDRTFQECTALTTVIMPDSVTSMGAYVFNECSALESVKLSENLENLPNGTFNNAEALMALEIPYKTTITNNSTEDVALRGVSTDLVLTVYEGSAAHTWAASSGAENVTPTIYSLDAGLNYIVKVIEMPVAPWVDSVVIAQDGGRYVKANYEFLDEYYYKEKGSILRWYVEETDGFKLVEGENSLIFVPTSAFDGKKIKFSVTPKNEEGTTGIETFSNVLVYQYKEAQKPSLEITGKDVNEDGYFEFKYKYESPDYLDEGASITAWYKSDTLFGEYTQITGASGTTYKPDDETAFYKFSITPVDEDGNEGEKIEEGPFVYAKPKTNHLDVSEAALRALELPEDTYADLTLPLVSEDGAIYTWMSATPEIMDNTGKINRPAANEESVSVILTVYASYGFEQIESKYVVVVNKYTEPPTVSNQQLYQDSRPIKISYTYTDADGNAEGDTIYEWYYKTDANSEFVKIDGATGNMYAPTASMNGYVFKVKITPVDSSCTVGTSVETPEYTYVYKDASEPTANVKTTILTGLDLTGVYDYVNADGIPEGNSEYSWWIADTLLGSYTKIPGETAKTIRYDSSFDGKYVKFAVEPKDTEGNKGKRFEAIPVLISFKPAETFDEDFDIAGQIDTSRLVGGTVSIADDPAGIEGNTALKLHRTSEVEGTQSWVLYQVPAYTGATYYIIEADVYNDIETAGGTWDMFYLNGEGYLYKVVEKKNGGLWSRGNKNAYDAQIGTYKKATWQRLKLVLDMNNMMLLECSLDGEIREVNMPLRSAGNTVTKIGSFIQNAVTGEVYIDNLRVTPIIALGDGSLAKEDADAINLGVDLNEVIDNLNLPVRGSKNGSAITWESSDTRVISARGKVTRPAADSSDKEVTLTAYVVNGNDYFTRSFTVNVMRELTDSEIVERDASELVKEYDGILADKNIKLPAKGKYGSTYTWSTSDDAIISNSGEIFRGETKKVATLSATLTHGNFNSTVPLQINVVPYSSKNLVANGGIVTSSTNTQHHSVYAADDDYSTYWSSLSNDTAPFITLDMGKIREVNQIRIADRFNSISSVSVFASTDKAVWEPVEVIKGYDGDVICTMEFKKVSARYIRIEFKGDGVISANELVLTYKESDDDKVANGIKDIALPVDNTVTENFTVKTELADGTAVKWSSSNTSVIRFEGNTAVVTRGATNISVTLTATVTSGNEENFKSFTVVVVGTGENNGIGGGNSGSSGGSGGSGGGGSNSDDDDNPPADTPDVSGTVFTDIASVPWAEEAISKLASIGVVNGTSATTFEPGRNITREEFAAILCRGFNFDRVAINGGFADVKPTDWYYDAVMQLNSLGIINGMGDSEFGVGETISRQDMAVMIYRASVAASLQFGAEGMNFADAGIISSYAKEAVEVLSGAKIINGVGNECFNPHGKATRAEATVILSRIMDYANKVGN